MSCIDGYDPDSLSVEKAQELILALLAPVGGVERLSVRAALGRVLAADVVSPIDVPAHDNSAMDGYAIRIDDLAAAGETRLRIAGSAYAGRAFAGSLAPGVCVRIMTGAIVPAGADTVVIQEVVRVDNEHVVVPAGQKAGQNVRRSGEDLRAGHAALAAGKLLRPAEIGLLASLGIAEVAVRRRVRVAVFSTGDELCSIGANLKAGEVYDSNRYTLWSMLTRLGCDVLDMGVVRDDPAALEAALRSAAENADAIITSGGVSVGEADFIRALMAKLGEVAFWKIAMKPGRPMAFGRIGNAFLFGLPGNPVAVMVTFYQFVRQALLKMAGVTPLPTPPAFAARCMQPIRKGRGRTEFQRGVLYPDTEGWCVRPTGGQGSGILRSMTEANCFIVLEQERSDVAAGETVMVQPFEGLI
ncbi:MAG: molybdopterin molybdenumtransferase MoeA [Rhodocyclales bacterium GWA2_65_20]|nr:MAG: molybdopterin molybdenumtransferase MoeA [Rhodocyclales bacterium GWA2_65_20]